MPFVAKIKRDDPFRSADQREIDAMCRRIAAAAEYCAFAGWREDAGYIVYRFTTWAKARATQHWIDRSNIAQRPIPHRVADPVGELTRRRARDVRPCTLGLRGDLGMTQITALCCKVATVAAFGDANL